MHRTAYKAAGQIIDIPNLSAALDLFSGKNFKIPREGYGKQTAVGLMEVLVNGKFDIDARFDAALELRSRDKDPRLLKALFDYVETSTRYSEASGRPGFTLAQKKTGIL